VRRDVELCEIALEAFAPDRPAESKNCHTVGTISSQQNEGVTILEQQLDTVGES